MTTLTVQNKGPSRQGPVYITSDGLKRLESELVFLTTTKRVEIAEALHDALSGGDSIDNTEYQNVQYEQLLIEMRISDLQNLLADAQLISPGNGDGIARMGSTVIVEGEDNSQDTFMIVGSTEASPDDGRISDACPLGRALLERRVGETVEVQAPDGILRYKIVAIS